VSDRIRRPAVEPAADAPSHVPWTERVGRLLDACAEALARDGASRHSQPCAFYVPGRIEVFGKHTDYAGGRSLLAAVERGFVMASAAREDSLVRIRNVSSAETVDLPRETTHDGLAPGVPGWARYPATVLGRLNANFPDVAPGADIAFASDLPPAAGLSSSSAFVVATFLALDAVRLISAAPAYRATIRDDDDLAGYLAAVENGYDYGPLAGHTGVGTHGGSEDHTAILCARPGELVQYSFAPLHFEAAVALPAGYGFVIGSSGVRAEKTGAALGRYNSLAADARALARLWRQSAGGEAPNLGAIVAADPAAASRLRDIVHDHADPTERDRLLARLAQFTVESAELVPVAADALRRGDVHGFGAAAARSVQLAVSALDNQTPETMHLTESALSLGAVAASPFGAGFGGSVWALVADNEAPAFEAAWRRDYARRFPARQRVATFFATQAGAPACRLL
jgi:galactokinase